MKNATIKDHVTVSREEYEAFLQFKKSREFKPTKAVLKDFTAAHAELKAGKSLSYAAVVRKLGIKVK